MNKLSELRASFSSEVNQKEMLQKNLIIQILCSRRLLDEHVSILEEAMNDLTQREQKTTNILTIVNTGGALSACCILYCLIKNNYRYVIPMASGVLPILYLNKLVNTQNRLRYEAQLKDLVKALDTFEFSIKKATTFIADAKIMEHYAKIYNRYNKDNSIPYNLIQTSKRVIRALYCFVKYLEYFYKIEDEKLKHLYDEIEDVDNCKLMCEDVDCDDIKTHKEFFSLFAYVQSYLLLRLGIIFASNMKEGKFLLQKKIDDIIMKINTQTKLLPNFLSIANNDLKIDVNIQKQIDAELEKNLPKELSQIRSTTIDFTLKAHTLSILSQELENCVLHFTENYLDPNKKGIDNLMNNLEIVGTQIAICNDEQTRLIIMINKYLNKEPNSDKAIAEEADDKEESLNMITFKESDDEVEQKDDFFYVDPTNDIETEEKKDDTKQLTNEETDEEDLQIKLTKKCFKPVLAQLKERIEVIGEDMKEREKKVLKEKGIEVKSDDEQEERSIESSSSTSGSNEDLQIDDERKQKMKQNRNKYNENRDFLQSKQQLNLFGMQSSKIPIPLKMHEDIYK